MKGHELQIWSLQWLKGRALQPCQKHRNQGSGDRLKPVPKALRLSNWFCKENNSPPPTPPKPKISSGNTGANNKSPHSLSGPRGSANISVPAVAMIFPVTWTTEIWARRNRSVTAGKVRQHRGITGLQRNSPQSSAWYARSKESTLRVQLFRHDRAEAGLVPTKSTMMDTLWKVGRRSEEKTWSDRRVKRLSTKQNTPYPTLSDTIALGDKPIEISVIT